MSDPPPVYSGPAEPRWRSIQRVCGWFRSGHEWRTTDVIQLTHTWLASTDKRCQRCGKWYRCGGRLMV